jgi:hypothetical protein
MAPVPAQGGAEGSAGPRGGTAPSQGNYGGLVPGHRHYEKVKKLVDEGRLDKQDEVSSFCSTCWV